MASAPPPGLESSTVTEIITYLEANGGALPLGKVTRQFKGLKKAQVSEYFVLTVGENPNDPVVSIGELTGDQLSEVVARSKENSSSAISTAAQPMAAPAEVAMLEPAKVAEIAAILQANGGSLNLGKLSRQCKGVKKAQLEQHFYIEVEEGAPDFFVSLGPMAAPGTAFPGQAPAPAPGLLLAGGGLAAPAPVAPAPAFAAPVQPLDPLAVQQIAAVLSGNGGSISLGKLTRTFPGLKKAQVEQHFLVAKDARDSLVVHLQGAAFGVPAAPMGGVMGAGVMGAGLGAAGLGAASLGATGMGATGMGATGLGVGGRWRQPVVVRPPVATVRPPAGAIARTPTPAEASAAEPLSPERVEEVRAFIEASGGVISLGKLTRQFRGLKKVQLEPHFEIGQNEGEPDRCVRLPGMEHATLVPTLTQSRKQPRSEATALMTQPNGEEVQPLDPAKVQEVIAFLEANNGSLPLGRVTREFRGIKKAQLAQCFVMTVTDNPQDPIVSVGEPSAVVLNDLSSASERKRARRDGTKEPEGAGDAPPLDGMRLAEIMAAVVENGSPLPMGKLTRQFPGVKKSQLERHLVVSWEAEARDFMVGLSETSLAT